MASRHTTPMLDFHPSAAAVEGSASRGSEGATQFWLDMEASFDELTPNYEEIRDLGDAVWPSAVSATVKEGVPC